MAEIPREGTNPLKPRVKRVVLRGLLALVLALAGAELILQAAHLLARSREQRALPPGAAVILCLGDSHTYGAGVTLAESYPAKLEAKLRDRGFKVSVVNAGAPGYNTSELRRRLPDWLQTYAPAVVIVLAGVNNGWNRADAAWSDAADGLPAPPATRMLDWLQTRSRLVRALILARHRLDWTRSEEENARDRSGGLVGHRRVESGMTEPPERTYDRARRDLVAIVAQCRAGHALPLLMTYVTEPAFPFETPNHLLREVAAEMRVPLADNDRAFRPYLFRPDGSLIRAERDRLFLPDMHARGPAYDLIADNIIQTLSRERALEGLPKVEGKEAAGQER